MALRREKVVLDLDSTTFYATMLTARHRISALLRFREEAGPLAYDDGGPPYRWHGDDS